jgi:glutamate-ammonia-ligase adenylyltransferase
VEALAAQLIERLGRGEPDPAALDLAGDPEPAGAARAFLDAAAHPDLGPLQRVWVPALLASARPGYGASSLRGLAEARRRHGPGPLDLRRTPGLPTLLGDSNFLARLLLRVPALADELEGELAAPPDTSVPEPDWDAIRRAKYRGLLRVAARDLAGRSFEMSLLELSDLADGCLTAALAAAGAETRVEPPALLALGKLGGRELNFSSDVDLLFVYRPPPSADSLQHNHEVARLVRSLKQGLEQPTAEGFAYRVDLDLRPEGRTGALANSVDAALAYYESFGAEWERQMLIRLRPVAGPADAAEAFARGVAPFVYRRLIDPRVLDDVRQMKARIEEERRRAGRDIEAEVKEGPGGIRDVEFLVQSLQLFHGGREPGLRTGNVLRALRALARRGLLPDPTTASLCDAYLFLRRVEHALQLSEERQTARFPGESAPRTALARRMGYRMPRAGDALARLLDDWTSVRSQVRAHFEALVLGGET